MSKTSKNQLEIEVLPNGVFRLFGYCNGERIRKKSKDVTVLETLKTAMEKQAQDAQARMRGLNVLRMSTINDAQLSEAESAFRMLEGRAFTLLDCIRAAIPVLGTGKPKPVQEAMDEWIADLNKKRRADRTIEDYKARMATFFKMTPVETVGEISPAHIETYVFRDGLALGSQVNLARVIAAYLNFCVEKKFIGMSPFRLKLEDLKETARAEAPEIETLNPAQCQALLDAAINYNGGTMVPYVILCLWCCMRSAEAQRCLGEHIDFGDENLVYVRKEKRGKGERQVTIPANMVPLLKDCFARELIKKGESIHFTENDWNEIRVRAGLVTRGESFVYACGRASKGKLSDWQANTLRHTGISYLFKRSGDIADCTRQAGNSPDIAFKHYIKMTRKADADAFYSITGKLLAPALEQDQTQAA
jgi:integrase